MADTNKSKISEKTKERLDKIGSSIGNNNSNNNKNNNDINIDINKKNEPIIESLFEYDELKMYYGYPYWVTDKIEILQPKLGDIIEFGDIKFYSIVSTLCANTTSLRLQLWDMGVDWTKISDYELFIRLIKGFTPKETHLIFGDLNLSWFKPYIKEDSIDNKSIVLINVPRDENGNELPFDIENAIKIDEFVYIKIADYLRHMFDIHPKVEVNVKGKTTKQWIIEEERMNIEAEKIRNKGKEPKKKSFLFPLISSMLNHPGFKYKKDELKEVGIVEFMDSVKRLQTYESVTALMSGMYSGMLDTSKLNLKEELNWMRDLYK